MEDVTKAAVPESEEYGSYAKVSLFKRAMRTKAFSLFVLLIVIAGVFSILSPMANDGFQAFLRDRTFWRILQDLAVPGFLTIGVGCLIVSGNIDLSAATVGTMAGLICAVLMAWHGVAWYICLIIAMVASAMVGTINAILVNELKQAPFIATMAMSTVLTAVNMILATNEIGSMVSVVHYENRVFQDLGTYRIFGEVPAASVFMTLLFIIYGILLSKTKFGRTLYLMGGNRAATYLAGVNPRRISYFLFINCSVLAALSGITNASRIKMGSTQGIVTMQFTGITAALLGGISFGGGSGGMGGAFLGLLVIQTFNMGMTTSGGSPYIVTVLSGLLLLVALTFDYFNVRAQNKRVGA